MKVIIKSFQATPTSKQKRRHSEVCGDDEEHAISLPAQRVSTSDKCAIDAKFTFSEPIQAASKQTDGSVSYSQLKISIPFYQSLYIFPLTLSILNIP